MLRFNQASEYFLAAFNLFFGENGSIAVFEDTRLA
jgi:hypothetical protein